jgi:hypothetical protein
MNKIPRYSTIRANGIVRARWFEIGGNMEPVCFESDVIKYEKELQIRAERIKELENMVANGEKKTIFLKKGIDSGESLSDILNKMEGLN